MVKRILRIVFLTNGLMNFASDNANIDTSFI